MQVTERSRQPPGIQRSRWVCCQWNPTIVELRKHVPRKAANPVISNPSLVRINHEVVAGCYGRSRWLKLNCYGASTANAAAVKASCELIWVQFCRLRTKTPVGSLYGTTI